MSKRRENDQLGMNYSTAQNRLRKQILFKYIKLLNHDICFVCNQQIETIEELSIEHKIPWLDNENAKELFWDEDNITFSHLKCNTGRARKTILEKHPSVSAYRKGCRCLDCKEIQRLRIQKYRSKT